MSTRTDALVSQQETGKITASIIPVVSGCHPALVYQQSSSAIVPAAKAGVREVLQA
jgi:hypothetical protein